ncbi:hypothetical protein POM88_045075 [Heracleum sosnowskyi]|uniref:Transposase-associated domain-containing protein n=1 Tax=Heracleum sosnowskyi TaxID=360622 RepID=A0AAD8M4L4_9APIA|nr:hypothetical protein POM88_045075 [Heracleum sosnowskyi]
MDRNWIKAHRMTKEYKDGVEQFLKHAAKHAKNIDFILCPCKKCLNVIEVNGPGQLKEHLMFHGIDKTYTCWTYHGEKKGEPSSSNFDFDYQFLDTVDTNSMEDAEGVEKNTCNVINDEL